MKFPQARDPSAAAASQITRPPGLQTELCNPPNRFPALNQFLRIMPPITPARRTPPFAIAAARRPDNCRQFRTIPTPSQRPVALPTIADYTITSSARGFQLPQNQCSRSPASAPVTATRKSDDRKPSRTPEPRGGICDHFPTAAKSGNRAKTTFPQQSVNVGYPIFAYKIREAHKMVQSRPQHPE